MNARKFLVVVATVALILTAVLTSDSAKATGSPSDYRVPLIGWYKITQMDRVAGCINHEGQGRFMDISGSGGGNTDEGDPVYAAGPGITTVPPYDADGYGYSVLLESNGVTFRYAHLDKTYVVSGQSVEKGDLLGLLGDTGESYGAHLHWEAWYTNLGPNDTSFDIFAIPGVNAGNTPCVNDDQDYIDGEPLPSNPATSCAFYGLFWQDDPHIALFDDDYCQGNPIRLFGDPNEDVRYNLNGNTDYNDRTRSVYVPPGWATVVGANVDDNPYALTKCFLSSQDDLDPVQYDQTDPYGRNVWIGYNPTAGSNPSQLDGWDMVSYAAVSRTGSCFDPMTAVSSYQIGQGGQGENPDWLLEFSKAERAPIWVDIHTKVDAPDGVYDAHRILVDGNILFETSAGEFYYTWNTYGWSDGFHLMTVQYRKLSDNGSWGNALSYQEQYYLSPNRNGTAPCDGGEGVELTSGGECIRLTQSAPYLDSIGWSDRPNLVVYVNAPYDVLTYDSVNFDGPPQLVKSGETKSVGGNVSSIDFRSPLQGPYVPESPLGIGQYTSAYFQFDEGSGQTVSSSVGNINCPLIGDATFAAGRFDYGLSVPNTDYASGADCPAQDFGGPLTVELFVYAYGTGGDQRIAAQLEGGPNVGKNQWLIRIIGNRISAWVCHIYGCHEAYSISSIQANRWYYVMLTYDGDKTAKFYLDSVLQATIHMDFVMSPGATTLDIGNGYKIYNCNCEIDDLRISNIIREPLGPPIPTPTLQPTPTYVPTATTTPTETPTSTMTFTPTPTNSPTVTYTSTSTPTNVGIPTRTPKPTKTSRPPRVTNTPGPTNTPAPTRTPKPTHPPRH